MGQYENLVKALRHCVSDEKGVTKCAGCPYYPDITGCMDRLHTDAAAAIEALQAELEKKRTADCWGCKCEKLEPKRGKFEKSLHEMFDSIWDCDINHPIFQDTVGELMEAVLQAYDIVNRAKMEVQE